MPTLNWIGKEKIIKHHLDVPYRVLEHRYGFTEKGKQTEPTESGNMIIHGDNLEALKSLLPKYEGKIKCIYIDPPYNTGNEGWVYNDNVNHPKIKKWLEKTLNAEAEGKEATIGTDDLTRHDKWLCMMYPRLKLLHKLLAEDGAIFISIDDNEQSYLKIMMDEIFGNSNFITNFIWEKKKKPAFLSKHVGSITEYIACYSKQYEKLKPFSTNEIKTTENKKYPLNNSGNNISTLIFPSGTVKINIGNCIIEPQNMSEGNIITELLDSLEVLDNKNKNEFRLRGEWRYSQKKLDEIIKNNEEIIISKIPFRPNHIKKGGELKKIHNLLGTKSYNIGTNEDASAEIIELFETKSFDFSKPKSLIQFLIEISSEENSIILDSFSGSGTTAHAVLNLNKQDGGNRKFILVEMEDYAEAITSERVKRVINGYSDKEGTGGSFDFYSLGQPLFNEEGNLNEEVEIEKIREYIWFTETRTSVGNNNAIFLGQYNDTGYYFLYEKDEMTTLDYKTLANYVKTKAERYIIYADNCLLPEAFMLLNNIEFKKIPRDITRF